MRIISVQGLLVVALAGCSGSLNYAPPGPMPPMANTRVIDLPKDQVWNRLIPALSREFFVINTIERQSGLVNVSYSGNPERYIDCGRIISNVSNARGRREYDFAGARANQDYEVMNENGLFFISRSMQLEGRANIVVEELGPRQTRVTTNTRYVVSRTLNTRDMQGRGGTTNHSITLNSGGSGSFPRSGNLPATVCRPNGQFESELTGLAG